MTSAGTLPSACSVALDKLILAKPAPRSRLEKPVPRRAHISADRHQIESIGFEEWFRSEEEKSGTSIRSRNKDTEGQDFSFPAAHTLHDTLEVDEEEELNPANVRWPNDGDEAAGDAWWTPLDKTPRHDSINFGSPSGDVVSSGNWKQAKQMAMSIVDLELSKKRLDDAREHLTAFVRLSKAGTIVKQMLEMVETYEKRISAHKYSKLDAVTRSFFAGAADAWADIWVVQIYEEVQNLLLPIAQNEINRSRYSAESAEHLKRFEASEDEISRSRGKVQSTHHENELMMSGAEKSLSAVTGHVRKVLEVLMNEIDEGKTQDANLKKAHEAYEGEMFELAKRQKVVRAYIDEFEEKKRAADALMKKECEQLRSDIASMRRAKSSMAASLVVERARCDQMGQNFQRLVNKQILINKDLMFEIHIKRKMRQKAFFDRSFAFKKSSLEKNIEDLKKQLEERQAELDRIKIVNETQQLRNITLWTKFWLVCGRLRTFELEETESQTGWVPSASTQKQIMKSRPNTKQPSPGLLKFVAWELEVQRRWLIDRAQAALEVNPATLTTIGCCKPPTTPLSLLTLSSASNFLGLKEEAYLRQKLEENNKRDKLGLKALMAAARLKRMRKRNSRIEAVKASVHMSLVRDHDELLLRQMDNDDPDSSAASDAEGDLQTPEVILDMKRALVGLRQTWESFTALQSEQPPFPLAAVAAELSAQLRRELAAKIEELRDGLVLAKRCVDWLYKAKRASAGIFSDTLWRELHWLPEFARKLSARCGALRAATHVLEESLKDSMKLSRAAETLMTFLTSLEPLIDGYKDYAENWMLRIQVILRKRINVRKQTEEAYGHYLAKRRLHSQKQKLVAMDFDTLKSKEAVAPVEIHGPELQAVITGLGTMLMALNDSELETSHAKELLSASELMGVLMASSERSLKKDQPEAHHAVMLSLSQLDHMTASAFEIDLDDIDELAEEDERQQEEIKRGAQRQIDEKVAEETRHASLLKQQREEGTIAEKMRQAEPEAQRQEDGRVAGEKRQTEIEPQLEVQQVAEKFAPGSRADDGNVVDPDGQLPGAASQRILEDAEGPAEEKPSDAQAGNGKQERKDSSRPRTWGAEGGLSTSVAEPQELLEEIHMLREKTQLLEQQGSSVVQSSAESILAQKELEEQIMALEKQHFESVQAASAQVSNATSMKREELEAQLVLMEASASTTAKEAANLEEQSRQGVDSTAERKVEDTGPTTTMQPPVASSTSSDDAQASFQADLRESFRPQPYTEHPQSQLHVSQAQAESSQPCTGKLHPEARNAGDYLRPKPMTPQTHDGSLHSEVSQLATKTHQTLEEDAPPSMNSSQNKDNTSQLHDAASHVQEGNMMTPTAPSLHMQSSRPETDKEKTRADDVHLQLLTPKGGNERPQAEDTNASLEQNDAIVQMAEQKQKVMLKEQKDTHKQQLSQHQDSDALQSQPARGTQQMSMELEEKAKQAKLQVPGEEQQKAAEMQAEAEKQQRAETEAADLETARKAGQVQPEEQLKTPMDAEMYPQMEAAKKEEQAHTEEQPKTLMDAQMEAAKKEEQARLEEQRQALGEAPIESQMQAGRSEKDEKEEEEEVATAAAEDMRQKMKEKEAASIEAMLGGFLARAVSAYRRTDAVKVLDPRLAGQIAAAAAAAAGQKAGRQVAVAGALAADVAEYEPLSIEEDCAPADKAALMAEAAASAAAAAAVSLKLDAQERMQVVTDAAATAATRATGINAEEQALIAGAAAAAAAAGVLKLEVRQQIEFAGEAAATSARISELEVETQSRLAREAALAAAAAAGLITAQNAKAIMSAAMIFANEAGCDDEQQAKLAGIAAAAIIKAVGLEPSEQVRNAGAAAADFAKAAGSTTEQQAFLAAIASTTVAESVTEAGAEDEGTSAGLDAAMAAVMDTDLSDLLKARFVGKAIAKLSKAKGRSPEEQAKAAGSAAAAVAQAVGLEPERQAAVAGESTAEWGTEVGLSWQTVAETAGQAAAAAAIQAGIEEEQLSSIAGSSATSAAKAMGVSIEEQATAAAASATAAGRAAGLPEERIEAAGRAAADAAAPNRSRRPSARRILMNAQERPEKFVPDTEGLGIGQRRADARDATKAKLSDSHHVVRGRASSSSQRPEAKDQFLSLKGTAASPTVASDGHSSRASDREPSSKPHLDPPATKAQASPRPSSEASDTSSHAQKRPNLGQHPAEAQGSHGTHARADGMAGMAVTNGLPGKVDRTAENDVEEIPEAPDWISSWMEKAPEFGSHNLEDHEEEIELDLDLDFGGVKLGGILGGLQQESSRDAAQESSPKPQLGVSSVGKRNRYQELQKSASNLPVAPPRSCHSYAPTAADAEAMLTIGLGKQRIHSSKFQSLTPKQEDLSFRASVQSTPHVRANGPSANPGTKAARVAIACSPACPPEVSPDEPEPTEEFGEHEDEHDVSKSPEASATASRKKSRHRQVISKVKTREFEKHTMLNPKAQRRIRDAISEEEEGQHSALNTRQFEKHTMLNPKSKRRLCDDVSEEEEGFVAPYRRASWGRAATSNLVNSLRVEEEETEPHQQQGDQSVETECKPSAWGKSKTEGSVGIFNLEDQLEPEEEPQEDDFDEEVRGPVSNAQRRPKSELQGALPPPPLLPLVVVRSSGLGDSVAMQSVQAGENVCLTAAQVQAERSFNAVLGSSGLHGKPVSHQLTARHQGASSSRLPSKEQQQSLPAVVQPAAKRQRPAFGLESAVVTTTGFVTGSPGGWNSSLGFDVGELSPVHAGKIIETFPSARRPLNLTTGAFNAHGASSSSLFSSPSLARPYPAPQLSQTSSMGWASRSARGPRRRQPVHSGASSTFVSPRKL